MTLTQNLGFDTFTLDEMAQWAIATSTDWTGMVDQSARQNRVAPRPLSDGRFICNANVLTEENGFLSDVLQSLPAGDVQAVPLEVCRGLVNEVTDPLVGPVWPEWVQIAGAGLGPQGAEDGWPVGAHVLKDGNVWVSRVPGNVNEPLVNTTSTWSRKDGTFVVTAGWQYQIGEEVTEDGGATWHRVEQATRFAPSASPSQYVQIDGPGGDPLPQTDEWAAGVTYATGDTVTYQGTSYTCLQGHTAQVGWEPPNVPALWSQA